MKKDFIKVVISTANVVNNNKTSYTEQALKKSADNKKLFWNEKDKKLILKEK